MMRSMRVQTMRKISERDRNVLDHVARYRCTVVDALQRTVLPELSRNAVGKVARRLCDANLLAKYTFMHPTRYFVLGGAGANALGLADYRTEPLGPQALPMEYAVLAHALLGRTPRKRLKVTEVRERCPWLPDALLKPPHCVDERTGALELIRVDLGGPPDHVARKATSDLVLRRRLRPFLPLAIGGGFHFVLITVSRDKARAIRQAIGRQDWPTGIQVHFTIFPQLLSLTARNSHA
jgi:hypothetical protein